MDKFKNKMKTCRNDKGILVLKNLKNSTRIRSGDNIFSGREILLKNSF